MITSLEIKNLRSAKKVSVPIAPLTILVGVNGAGKSSIIRGLQLGAGWARQVSGATAAGVVITTQRDNTTWVAVVGTLSVPYYEWSRYGGGEFQGSEPLVRLFARRLDPVIPQSRRLLIS